MSIHLKSPPVQRDTGGLPEIPAHDTATVAASLTGDDAVAKPNDDLSEAAHWRENFRKQAYVEQNAAFEDYGPAYAYGVTQYSRYPAGTFDEVQDELADGWYSARGLSTLEWDRAGFAVRDAWQRLADGGKFHAISP